MSKYKIYFDTKVVGTGPLDSNILLVGEAPGNDECIFKKPFVGPSGQILNNCLSRNGIDRESIRIENLFPYRLWNDEFKNALDHPSFNDYLHELHGYISLYKPIIIGALGNYPMHYLTGKGKKSNKQIIGIGNWRGSILSYVDDNDITHEDIKVVPTYHPAFVARERSLYPIFDMDIRRIIEESKSRGLNYPEEEFIINPSGVELLEIEKELINSIIYTCDIEVIRNSTNILSISFSPSPNKAIVFNLETPERIRSISNILNANNKKVFHFGYFDTTQLKLNGFSIKQDDDSIKLDRPYFWDTYLAAHILEPELPKTLAFETSVRTRRPYYKHEGRFDEGEDQKSWNTKTPKDKLYRYNGKDTMTTFEILIQQYDELRNDNQAFNFEMAAIELQTHISDSGMLIDQSRLELIKNALMSRWTELQYIIDGIIGIEVNVKSPTLKDILYSKEGLDLPTRTFQKRVTTNDAALVSLIAWCKDKINTSVREDTKKKYKTKLNIIRAIREIREIRQLLSTYIEAKISGDGRIRSTFKYGPETGRWSASKYVDGSGINAQTFPRS